MCDLSLLNGYFIGNIPNIFRQTHLGSYYTNWFIIYHIVTIASYYNQSSQLHPIYPKNWWPVPFHQPISAQLPWTSPWAPRLRELATPPAAAAGCPLRSWPRRDLRSTAAGDARDPTNVGASPRKNHDVTHEKSGNPLRKGGIYLANLWNFQHLNMDCSAAKQLDSTWLNRGGELEKSTI